MANASNSAPNAQAIKSVSTATASRTSAKAKSAKMEKSVSMELVSPVPATSRAKSSVDTNELVSLFKTRNHVMMILVKV